jgi:hypothetical protein
LRDTVSYIALIALQTTKGKGKDAEQGEIASLSSPGGGGAALQIDFASIAESLGDGCIGVEGSFVQWVFEVRVRPSSYRVQGNTLGRDLWGQDGQRMWGLEFDPLCNRQNLEWLIEREEDIVCTAVMMRDIPTPPREHNRMRFDTMKKHVGWDGKRATRPRDYGGAITGAVRWQYNDERSDGSTLSYSDRYGLNLHCRCSSSYLPLQLGYMYVLTQPSAAANGRPTSML